MIEFYYVVNKVNLSNKQINIFLFSNCLNTLSGYNRVELLYFNLSKTGSRQNTPLRCQNVFAEKFS